MSRTRRATVAALAATTLAMTALTGCGRSRHAGGRARRARPSARTRHRRDHRLGDGHRGREARRVREGVHEREPGREGQRDAVPWDAAHDKIATAIAGEADPGRLDDRHHLDGRVRQDRRARPDAGGPDRQGRLLPGRAGTPRSSTAPSYGVPWYVETRVLYYRKDLAADRPASPSAEDLGRPDGDGQGDERRPARSGASTCSPARPVAGSPSCRSRWQRRARSTNEDDEFTLDSPEIVEALAYYQSFFTEGLAPTDLPEGALEPDFVAGKIGAFISGPWHIGLLKSRAAPASWTSSRSRRCRRRSRRPRSSAAATWPCSRTRRTATAPGSSSQWLSEPEVQVKWYQAVKRPAGRAGRVGRRGAVRRRAPDDVRRAAARRQGAAGDPDLGAGRGRRSTPRSRRSGKAGADPAEAARPCSSRPTSIGTGL